MKAPLTNFRISVIIQIIVLCLFVPVAYYLTDCSSCNSATETSELVPIAPSVFTPELKYETSSLFEPLQFNFTGSSNPRLPRRIAFTFDQNYRAPTASTINCQKALWAGFHDCQIHNFSSVNPEFLEKHKDVFEARRGAGYWLWKPYLILRYLVDPAVEENDIVFYSDAGSCMISPVEPMIETLRDRPFLVFTQPPHTGHFNAKWTRRDAFVLMDCDTEECYMAMQADAAFFIAKKNAESIAFVQEWLHYATDLRIVGDGPNTQGLPNHPDFHENRHDQSVLGLLAFKYGIEYSRSPSQFHTESDTQKLWHASPYSQDLVNHHRGGNTADMSKC